MGMNVAFRFKGDGPFKPFPEGKDWDGCLPRYTDSWEFMKAIYDVEHVSTSTCSCKKYHDKHDYYCEGDTMIRPVDFVALREKAKNLQPVWLDIIQYLEDEPAAYVEYG